MGDYRNLLVWQRAHALTVRIHTMRISNFRAPGLASQLRRSCAAIGANIAEGADYPSRSQFAHYIDIAIASSRETQNHLELGRDVHAISAYDAEESIAAVIEVRKMLFGLRKQVRRSIER